MELIVVLLLIVIVILLAVIVRLWPRTTSPTLAPVPLAVSAAAEEQELLRRVVDASSDIIFVVGPDGRYRFSNRAHYESFGAKSSAAVIGKTAYELFPREIAAAFGEEDALVRRTHRPFSSQLPHTADNGQLRWQQVIKIPILDARGETESISAVVRDISQIKAVEEGLNARITQFHLLSLVDTEIGSSLDLSRVAMYALDMLLRISVADAGYVAVLSRDAETLSVVAVIGDYTTTKLNNTLTPDYGITGRVITQQKAERVLNVHDDPDYMGEIPATNALIVLPLVSQDQLVGIIRLEASRAERFTDDMFQFAQLIAGRIALAVDNARLYYLVEQKLHEMSKLEQIKTDMIRMASHDLKNPLAVIEGYLMLLMMDAADFDEGTQDMLVQIQRAVGRMNRILMDILSIERINQRARDEFHSFDLGQLVQAARDEFEPQITARAQHLVEDIGSTEPLLIEGDEAQLYEAITNLISNAMKYTPEGGTITLHVSNGDDKVRFYVRDTGYGIPTDMQDRLFEPFFRAKTDQTIHIEGTGLGLHLVRNIIKRHNGVMLFESEYGKGSLFGFEIPRVSA